ncbi:MAG: agmatinase [Firmicutes bacterium]|nr:agmatinase [Bacillota bacterium]
MKKQPSSALDSPRFCNPGTFMRMPGFTGLDGLDFVIIGVPFDTGSSYRSGSRFGPTAIRNISAMIKPNNVQLEVNILDNLQGADWGDMSIVPGYIEPTFAVIERDMDPIVQAGVTPICLGGDHSITLAELRALAKKHGPLSLVHFDSHLDLNKSVFGEKHNHGTPFRRAVEEGLINPESSIQVGMRGSLYDPDDFKIAAELGFKVITADEVRELGFKETGRQIRERVGNKLAFFTFDIDFVDPAYAPGTGTPEVGGFTSYETLTLVRETKDINFVGFDVVEVLPAYDCAEITAYLAANVVFEFISMLAAKKKNKG